MGVLQLKYIYHNLRTAKKINMETTKEDIICALVAALLAIIYILYLMMR